VAAPSIEKFEKRLMKVTLNHLLLESQEEIKEGFIAIYGEVWAGNEIEPKNYTYFFFLKRRKSTEVAHRQSLNRYE
jgi:hypothetical protein